MQLPWRTSARTGLSSGSSVVVAAVTGLLLAFVAASAVLCAVSTGNAALGYQTGRACPQSLAPSVDGIGVPAAKVEQVARDAREVAARQGFPQPLFGAYTRTYRLDLGGRPSPWLRFGYRDDATGNLRVVRGGSPGGLWLAQSPAQDANIGLGPLSPQLPPVTAIYSDLSEPVPPFWCTEVRSVVYNLQAPDGGSSTTAFLPDLADVVKLDRPLDISVRFPVAAPKTLAEARDLGARSDRLAEALREKFAADGLTGAAPVLLPFASALAEAEKAQTNVIAFVLPLTAISLLVGLVGVGAMAAQWCQRRRSVLRLLWSRGSSPIALGAKAVLELGGPLVLGAVVGLVVARVALPWYAPVAELDPGTTTWAVLVVLGTVACAAAVLTATAALRTHRMFQAPRHRRLPRALRLIPFELPVAVAAVFSWIRLTQAVPKTGVTPPLDAFALAFPVLVVVAIAGIAARLGRLLLAWSHRLSVWSLPSVQLAVRRLAAASTAATGVLLVGVLAVGTLAVGNSVNRAEQEALASKSGDLIGAATSVQISTSFGISARPLPSTVDNHATVVAVVDRGASNMVAVDPATFADGAWIDPERRGELLDLVGRLGHGAAIAVGGVPTGSVSVPGFVPLHTIGQLPVFPGMPDNAGYETARSDITTASEINSFFVWSGDDADTVLRQLAAGHIDHIGYKTTEQALDALPFYTVAWTFGYIASVGALLAVIAAASLLLAVGARRRQTALSGALATRMGLRPATLVVSHLLEFGAVAGSVLSAGVTVGLVTAALSVPRLDPAPWLRPVEALPNSAMFVLIAVVTGLAVVAAAGWIAVRGVRTARIGELIRG
jgi:putative ABC transport system permease protein